MKQCLTSSLLLVLTAFLVQCEKPKQLSKGQLGEVVVLMDINEWDGDLGESIRETFGKWVSTLPTLEESFKLIPMSLSSNEDLMEAKMKRNLIIVSPIDATHNTAGFTRALLSDDVKERVRDGRNFAFPLRDHWARDQWVLVLAGQDSKQLAEKIRFANQSLVNNLLEVEWNRITKELYKKGEQVALSDSLWKKHGFKIRIQHDYRKHIDTTDFVTFRRFMPENDRWIWIWWKDQVRSVDFLTADWINHKRDSLMATYYKGSKEDMWITTEYKNRDVHTTNEEINGYYAFVTRGTWRMHNGGMGGPFVNYTYYVPEQQRVYVIEFGQFAPQFLKLRFVRQFEAMGRTFEADKNKMNDKRRQLSSADVRPSASGN